MSLTILGFHTIKSRVTNEGHREYDVSYRVQSSDASIHGPYDLLTLNGIPRVGDPWNVYGSIDNWAYCQPQREVVPVQGQPEDEKTKFWDVVCKYSTKPNPRCQELNFTSPLQEPMKVKISSGKRTAEATQDRHGLPIRNSAHELIKGPIIEFDEGLLTVEIEQNVAEAELELLTLCFNRVNSYYLWGMPPRSIRLTGITAERSVYGRCNYYWHRTLRFDLDDKTFDRDVLDEGTKVLNGHWATRKELEKAIGTGVIGTGSEYLTESLWVLDPINGILPDPNNPTHFKRYMDREGNLARVILNGSGLPANTSYFYPVGGVGTNPSVSQRYVPLGTNPQGLNDEADPGYFRVEKYLEANFLLLGIPTDLNFTTTGTGTGGY